MYTPPVLNFAMDDAANWYVRGWSSQYGIGPYSEPRYFGVACSAAPALAPDVLTPGDTTTDSTPAYTWLHDFDTANYGLYTFDADGNLAQASSVSARDAGCLDDGNCSFTPTSELSVGYHAFYINGNNACGSGPYGVKAFTNQCSAKPSSTITQLGPEGFISTNFPTYRWQHNEDALYYFLYAIDIASNTLESRWISYLDADCNDDGICEIPAATATPSGYSLWYLWAYNSCGLADSLSAGKVFSAP